ncbi:aspartate--tRNA ligase, partial [Candidatus Woesearchaeota archaeon]|nr:aspartate--tRNA ligase [Candidatus Woesearchaeota archaeon]
MRTHNCGELDKKALGKKVKLCGWDHKRRDHGGIIFIDLRDKYGLTQIVFDPKHNKDAHETAENLGREDVIQVLGTVRERPEGMENKRLVTGEVEVLVEDIFVLAKADTPPMEVNDRVEANEEMRLKFRYLDLRRPTMQKRLYFRHRCAQSAREYLSANGFMEIETPMLVKSTPEGARDYIVPSRVNPGKFYALPQSPQLYKQILMVGGCDRYFQLARCLRDEDLRADRQPEHTQIDLEMSFVDVDDVLALVEGLMKHVFKKVLGKDIKTPFPRLPYKEAMDSYGIDKPDLRFGLELADVTETVKGSDFQVFKNAEMTKCLAVEDKFTRKDIE